MSTSSGEEVTRPKLKKAGHLIVHFAAQVKLHLDCIFVSGHKEAQKAQKRMRLTSHEPVEINLVLKRLTSHELFETYLVVE